MTKQKRGKNIVLIFLLCSAVFGLPSVKASEKIALKPTVDGGNKVLDIQKTFNKSKPFLSDFEGGGLERVLPFYSAPFSAFEINLESLENKSFKAGEELSLGMDITFSSKNIASELEKIRDLCFTSNQGRNQAEKELACQSGPLYSFDKMEDVSVLTQIWRQDPNRLGGSQKGDFLVDEFYGAEKIDLLKGETGHFNLRWKVPAGLPSGKYYASFFINQYKSFTLLNFPVNVFSPSNRFDFEINEEETGKGSLVINKDNVKINGYDYSQVLPVPNIKESDGKIKFEVPVLNTGDREVTGELTYRMSRWTQEDPKDKLEEKRRTVTVQGKSQEVLNLEFPADQLDSVCNLQVSVVQENTKSMIDIHFAIEGKNRGVIRFLGVAKDERNVYRPFFCLRNAQWTGQFEGKFSLSFFEGNGNKPVGEWVQDGIMESRDDVCFVLKGEKIPNLVENKCMKIEGQIFDQNNLSRDKKEIFFNCSGSESSQRMEIIPPTSGGKFFGSVKIWLLSIGFLTVGGLLWFLKKYFKK